MSYKFVRPSGGNMTYNPKKSLTNFYQICQYPYSEGLHMVRRVTVNEEGAIVDVKHKGYETKRIKKFKKNNQPNKYNMYPTSDIRMIKMPTAHEILTSKSELLSQSGSNYDDYAPA